MNNFLLIMIIIIIIDNYKFEAWILQYIFVEKFDLETLSLKRFDL